MAATARAADTTAPTGAPGATPRAPLERIDWIVDSLLARPELRGAEVGILVRSLNTGELLYERNADTCFIPASNMKILTACAALDILGPGHSYTTVLSSDAPVVEGRLTGDLYVRGSGDPSIVFEDMVRLVESLRFRGIERIDGDIVLDDRLFGEPGPVDPDSESGDRAYHARVGALVYNFNAVAVRVGPGARSGDRAAVALSPDVGFVDVRNAATTGSPRQRSTLTVRRRTLEGRNTIVVEGRVPAGAPPSVSYRNLDDPTGYFAAGFVAELGRAGIEVGGSVRRGAGPAHAGVIVQHESKPLSLLVRDLGKYSNNVIAEQLLMTLAVETGSVPATTEAGAAAVENYVSRLLGEDAAERCRVADGSGFSRENRVTPRVLVAALDHTLTSFETLYEFGGSLSVSGVDGTLSDRMGYPDLEGAVRAKTGLLDGVTAISGVAEMNGGELAVFSILVNDFSCEAWRSHDLEHAVLGAIRQGRG
jgi:D-alanyl-D-alanine carboxypeptidase/D-alanyl-D-alanine-endopeptidase (penicillin-binding protein 4)